jgi:hypothetical protein
MVHRTRSCIVAAAAATILAGCASTIVHPTTTVSPSLSPQPTQALPSPTPTPSIPTGFRPQALTAISEADYWVLGTSRCTTSVCGSEILHTVNAGQSFQPIASPPVTFLAGTGSNPGGPAVDDIRFADTADGWIFGDSLWATHSGGTAWHELAFSVTWSNAGGTGGLFSNGAMVAALSSQRALVGGAGNTISVTANGGRTYQAIAELVGAQWAGFTDSSVGYVIAQRQDNGATQLWRTTDSGTKWSVVSLL